MDGCPGSLHAGGRGPGGAHTGSAARAGRTHLPHGGRPLRRPPRRRRPQPRGRRVLEGLPPGADHRIRRRHRGLLRSQDRDSLRLDRRTGLPAPRKHGSALFAVAQRPARRRGRRPADPRGVRPLALHPRGGQQLPGAAALAPAADRRRTRRAGDLRRQLPLLSEQTVDRRLRDRAGSRHAGARLRNARPENHRLQRLQLRRAGDRGLRHLFAAGQAPRLQHDGDHHPRTLDRHGPLQPLHLRHLCEQVGGRKQEPAALQRDALHAAQRRLQGVHADEDRLREDGARRRAPDASGQGAATRPGGV